MSPRRNEVRPNHDEEPGALAARSIILTLLASFFTMIGFYLLLSVVPLYTEEAGGGSSGAGLATAVFMLSTVLAQTWMPRVLARFGYRAVLAAGMLLLGLPAFLYAPLGAAPAILAVTLVRGAGFGAVIVALAALVVELAPPGRRGEALGLYGVVLTLPTIFCSALGLWLVERFGYGPVFALGALAPLFGFVAALGIPSPDGRGEGGSAGFFSGLGRGPLLRIFLLVLGLASTLSRWWAGRFGDRRDPRLLLAPGLVCAALGMVALTSEGLVLLGGALLFGAGFGTLQNATLLLTMQRVSKSEYGLGSTLWNVAFDAGTGVGAFVFGFVVGAAGFSWAFGLCAGLLVAALALIPGEGELS